MLLNKPYDNLHKIENSFPDLYGDVDYGFQKERYAHAFSKFKNIYNVNAAYIASSSGRIEICGNHTDHNGGKALVATVNLDTIAFFLPTNDNLVSVTSEGYKEFKVDLSKDYKEKQGTSSALVYGVSKALKDAGYRIGGFNAYITSNVPSGAGISSSAAFELLICEILNFLYNQEKISAEDKAKFSQFAENVYFGKPCGLLDQTAISFGGLNMLDFHDEKHIAVTGVNDNLSDYTFVLINTGGSHANLTGEYAAIPNEMRQVAKCFNENRLIDVSETEFYSSANNLNVSDRAINRAIHFYEENTRVKNCFDALIKKDYALFLKQINDSGVSSLCKLQNCYVAGAIEQPIPKALFITSKFFKDGANRVHGGGFAGTILNIVKNSEYKDFVAKCDVIFGKENVIPLKIRRVGTKTL